VDGQRRLGFLACVKTTGEVRAGAFEKYIREKADTVFLQLHFTRLIISLAVKRALHTNQENVFTGGNYEFRMSFVLQFELQI
jgi:hypothetical protein